MPARTHAHTHTYKQYGHRNTQITEGKDNDEQSHSNCPTMRVRMCVYVYARTLKQRKIVGEKFRHIDIIDGSQHQNALCYDKHIIRCICETRTTTME